MDDCDFSGYATKANKRCSDGLTIMPAAFQHMNKQTVPLVWQHVHNQVEQVLGHAILEDRGDGVYAYGFFNKTPAGENARLLLENGDINMMSIYANNLVEKNKRVLHGNIREVSLVLAGANPEARIDYVRIKHGEFGDMVEELTDEAIITSGEVIAHSEKKTLAHKTFNDVYATLDDDQKALFEYMISQALDSSSVKQSDVDEDDEEEKSDSDDTESDDNNDDPSESDDEDLTTEEGKMRHNVFEQNDKELKHSSGDQGGYNASGLTKQQVGTLVQDALKMGLQEAILQHADEYGVTNIEMLFPDAQAIDRRPEWITRRMEWVEQVLNATYKLPFSRIKSMSADLTHAEARAKGYIKASVKKDQFFAVAKRETTPKTIYKKQRLDRDDIIDITDFDVIAWFWVEMRFMLREEIARAILVGDGREVDDPDKIDENKIRPIAHDDEFYTDVIDVPANISPEDLVEAVLRGRYRYKGNSPTAYMTNQVMTDMLLVKDAQRRRLYRTTAELAAELNVREIVEVPVMEDVTREGGTVLMILVNLSDYHVGSTRGGEISTFQQFDMDVNQEKLLIEGRMSGALVRHKTAQVVVRGAGTSVTPPTPTYNSGTGVVTLPDPFPTGVSYKNKATGVTLSPGAQPAIAVGSSMEVLAVPTAGYYFPHNFDADWTYTRTA